MRTTVLIGRIAAAFGLLLVAAGGALAEPALLAPARLEIPVGTEVVQVPYRSNVDLAGAPRSSQRAIVVIHGTQRNAVDYFDWMSDAAVLAGDAGQTIVLAPQFVTVEEVDAYALPADHPYWSDGGWKQGDRSEDTPEHPRSAQVSSFTVIEEFVRQLTRVAPDLQSVVLVGHSAGGQFVQRFAAGNGVDGSLGSVTVRYVVANPSSYMYLSPERAEPGSWTEFSVPSGIECPTWYHDYKYGLLELNEYMGAVGAAGIQARYDERRISYLLGEDDDDPADPYLDQSCAALLQGPHRLARGVVFYRSLLNRFGSTIASRQNAAVVRGVGHSARRMFQSDCGLFTIFGNPAFAGECSSVEDALPPATEAAPVRRRQLAFGGAFPNPFNPRTTLEFTSPDRSPVVVGIYTGAGRLIREVRLDPGSDGRAEFVWDGTDAGGGPVASGVYRIRARQGPATVSGAVVLVR